MQNKEVENVRENVNDKYIKLRYINKTKRLSWYKKRRYSNI